MKSIIKAFIKIYAYLVSPLLGPSCRFYPTCSCYAHDAIDRFGVIKGGILALRRIIKCHPWHRGVFDDPVPSQIDWRGVFGYKSAKPSIDDKQ
jgi:uncharacterized protein